MESNMQTPITPFLEPSSLERRDSTHEKAQIPPRKRNRPQRRHNPMRPRPRRPPQPKQPHRNPQTPNHRIIQPMLGTRMQPPLSPRLPRLLLIHKLINDQPRHAREQHPNPNRDEEQPRLRNAECVGLVLEDVGDCSEEHEEDGEDEGGVGGEEEDDGLGGEHVEGAEEVLGEGAFYGGG